MIRPMFTVVIPTIGRETLGRTVESIRSQSYCANAEIIVVMDTHGGLPEEVEESVRSTCKASGFWPLSLDAGAHDIGSPQLHMGFQRAHGVYVLNCGDDDVYEPGAFQAMASAIERQDVYHPLMFKVELHPAPHRGNREPVVLWDRQEIAEGRVTGQGFVCPNDPQRMGRWVNDWTFMRETVALHGGRIEWREELIARCC